MNYAPSFCKTTRLFLRRTLILSVILFSIVGVSFNTIKVAPLWVITATTGHGNYTEVVSALTQKEAEKKYEKWILNKYPDAKFDRSNINHRQGAYIIFQITDKEIIR